MTQEEKQLLLKDLCARLPYGVVINKKVSHSHQIEELNDIGYGQRSDEVYINGYPLKNSKPYLRPMSSMTEEELKEFYMVEGMDAKPIIRNKPKCDWHFTTNGIDYLLSHHFDFRGLIPMGLAIESPDDMYKTV